MKNLHGNIAVDVDFKFVKKDMVYSHSALVYARLGNRKSIPIKIKLCGMTAY